MGESDGGLGVCFRINDPHLDEGWKIRRELENDEDGRTKTTMEEKLRE